MKFLSVFVGVLIALNGATSQGNDIVAIEECEVLEKQLSDIHKNHH